MNLARIAQMFSNVIKNSDQYEKVQTYKQKS